MNKEHLSAIALASVLVSGCASSPRAFAPELAAPPPDMAAYQQVLETCQQEAGQSGHRGKGKDVELAAKGAGGAAIGGAAVSGASWSASVAAVSAAVVAVPVFGIAWGIGRVNRTKKEKRINAAAGQCLMDKGYAVASWKRVKRPRKVELSQIEAESTEMPGG